jgi:hypothetical protein
MFPISFSASGCSNCRRRCCRSGCCRSITGDWHRNVEEMVGYGDHGALYVMLAALVILELVRPGELLAAQVTLVREPVVDNKQVVA